MGGLNIRSIIIVAIVVVVLLVIIFLSVLAFGFILSSSVPVLVGYAAVRTVLGEDSDE